MTRKFKVHSKGCSAVGKMPGLEEKGPVFFLKHTTVTSPPPNLWDFIVMSLFQSRLFRLQETETVPTK